MKFASALNVRQMGTPPKPSAGESLIYPKSDGAWYTQGSDGVEKAVGGATGSGSGGLVFVNRESHKAFWGNTSLPNLGAGYTATITPATSRPTANLVHVEMTIAAQSQGDVNQAVDYYLEVNVGGGFQQLDQTLAHNYGGPSNSLGTTLSAWVPISPGATFQYRALINIEGGSPAVIFGMANAKTTFFVSGGAAVGSSVPADSGWQNFPGAGGWTAYGNGHRQPQIRRIGNQIFLRGLCGSATNHPAGAVLGTMPVGWRPTQIELFEVQSSSGVGTRVDVNTDGTVVVVSQPINTGGWLSLAGLSYFLD